MIMKNPVFVVVHGIGFDTTNGHRAESWVASFFIDAEDFTDEFQAQKIQLLKDELSSKGYAMGSYAFVDQKDALRFIMDSVQQPEQCQL